MEGIKKGGNKRSRPGDFGFLGSILRRNAVQKDTSIKPAQKRHTRTKRRAICSICQPLNKLQLLTQGNIPT